MRLRLVIAYVGTGYSGWQVQPGPETVQGALEDAVADIGGRRVRVTGASRTDAGVHATGQVCHVDAPRELPPGQWQDALNAVLPADVRVLEAGRVDDDFHARHHARRKYYVYRIDTAPVQSPFLAPWAWHRPGLQEDTAAHLLARGSDALLVDDLDQRRFASQPDGTRPIRPLERCAVAFPATRPTTAGDPAVDAPSTPVGPLPDPTPGSSSLVTITVVGRSFLRHAVRGMVGTLAELALGRRSWEEFDELVRGSAGHRPLSSKAPAHGLCLERIDY